MLPEIFWRRDILSSVIDNRRLRPAIVAVLSALLAVSMAAQSAIAANLLRVEVVLDGSSNPPGDRIDLTVLRAPNEKLLELHVRAFRIAGEDKAEPIQAAGDRNRDRNGAFLLVAPVRVQQSDLWIEQSVTIPYADLKLPLGDHRIAYEVSGYVEGRLAFAKATPLTRLVVTKEDQREILVQTQTKRTVTTLAHLTAFVGGRVGALEKITVDVREQNVVSSSINRKTTVKIPGGFLREQHTAAAAIHPKDPPRLQDKAILKSVPWQPLSASLKDNERAIFFATNRKPLSEEKAATKKFFGTEPVDAVTYGSCVVNIPLRTHRKGTLDTAGYWSDRDPEKFFLIETMSVLTQESFAQHMKDDVFVFVHGFNHEFSDSVLRTAQLAQDINFPGRSVSFCWPSAGSMNAYKQDRKQAQQSAAALAGVIAVLMEAMGPKSKVHILAHSLVPCPD